MPGQYNQIVDDIARSRLGTVAREELDNQMTLIDDKFRVPLEVSVGGAVITIGPGVTQTQESNGVDGVSGSYYWRLPMIGGQNVVPVQSTLNLSTGAVTGAFDTPVNALSVTANQYVKMGIELRNDGQFYVVWGAEAASQAAATFPNFSTSNAVSSLYVELQKNGSTGTWSFLSVTKPNFYIFKGGGGGGGSGKVITVAWSGELQKDVDVSVYGLNARKCQCSLQDTTNYETREVKFRKPNVNTVRIIVGEALEAGNYELLVNQVE